MRDGILTLALALIVAAPAGAQTVSAPAAKVDRSALPAEIAALSHPAAVYVIGHGADAGAATAPLTPETPLRIASNTKTFVAATILRLWEQNRIALDAPIAGLIAPEYDVALRGDGFDTTKITIRHVLSHSAGLYDHGSDKRFVDSLMTMPGRKWTRAEQVKASVDWGDPLGPPGTVFRYSDTGYILLGDIIERVTRKPLARAVREELGFSRLGLTATWWEVAERPPRGAMQRGRQYLGTTEVTRVDPSIDLYGGGGLVMSPRDLATFFKALFGGRVFAKPATLREMLWKGSHSGADTYRLGIFVKHTPRGDIWWHTGFWGTYAAYAPSTDIAVAAMSDHQDGLKSLVPIAEKLLFAPAPR